MNDAVNGQQETTSKTYHSKIGRNVAYLGSLHTYPFIVNIHFDSSPT